MKWINATRLVQWSNTRASEGLLPELVRKLIVASSRRLSKLEFPSGDSIYKPSWDGKCVNNTDHLYIPKGASFWELGRDNDYRRKLSKEYSKRTKQTQARTRKQSTFVFITPRRWVGKEQSKEGWIATKLKLKQWKNICIYDADDLEHWLEMSPAVGLWLAKKLNIATDDAEPARAFWKKFIGKLPLTPSVVLASRNKEKKLLLQVLNGDSGVTEIQGTSKAETIAFLIAAAISEDSEHEEAFFSKAIVLTKKESLKTITAVHGGLVIIYHSTQDEALDTYDAGANHVFNPVSFNVKSSGPTIPIPKSQEFIKGLESIGFSFEASVKMSRESGRSFSILGRLQSNSPGRVSWNAGRDIAELIPVFLIQKFDENATGDRQMVAKISNGKYEDYKESLKAWSLISDRPILQLSNYWKVISPYDLLHVVSKRIAEHHLMRFEEVFLGVFNETDPALELEPKMRLAAALFNKESPFSGRIKEGLCNTLILLAVFGETAGITVNFNIQDWVDGLVRKLLTNRDEKFWMSIENKLHLLAEASPKSFMTAFEELISDRPEIISAMFGQKEFDLFTPSYYVHVLWALEALAWGPAQLSRVSLILVKLAKFDKDIKTANKPANSLRHIFLLWLPQTYAPLQARHDAIELIVKRDKMVAFDLLRNLAPKSHDTGFFNYKPLYRLRDLSSAKVSRSDWQKGISFVASKLVEIASNDYDKWREIIDLVDDFHGDDRNNMTNSLVAIQAAVGDKTGFSEKLRDFIQRHEGYSGQDWALPAQDLIPLKDFYDKLIENDIDRYFWYFNVDTIEPYGTEGLNYDSLVKRSNEKRREVVKSIFSTGGLTGIYTLASRVERPGQIGYFLAESNSRLDDEIMSHFIGGDPKLEALANGFAYYRSKHNEFDWIKHWAEKFTTVSPKVLANFFLAIDANSKTWNLLDQVSTEASREYWKRGHFHNGHFRDDQSELLECVRHLNTNQRYLSSLNMIIFEKEKFSPDLIIETLESFATNPMEDGRLAFGASGIQDLFTALDNADLDEQRMLQLEWAYLQILNDSPHHRPPKYLYKTVIEKPKFFAELMSYIYLPENKIPSEEISNEESSRRRNLAKRADELLDTLNSLPGENPDHSISEDLMRNWIKLAIAECIAMDLEANCYYRIGKLIGISRERASSWPQVEICQIIEDLQHKKLNEGFVDGTINGSRVRASFRPAGGKDEYTAFETYKRKAEELSTQFPLVSQLIMEVANFYKRWAEFMNAKDEQTDLDD